MAMSDEWIITACLKRTEDVKQDAHAVLYETDQQKHCSIVNAYAKYTD